MQGSDNQGTQTTESTNVVSLFGARNKAAEVKAGADLDAKKDEESFEEIQSRNQKNKERLAKERNSANKSVLRSYRIKN